MSPFSTNMQELYEEGPNEKQTSNAPNQECEESIDRENQNDCDRSSYPNTEIFQFALSAKHESTPSLTSISTSDCESDRINKEASCPTLLSETPPSSLEQKKVANNMSAHTSTQYNPYAIVKNQSRVLIPPRELKTAEMLVNGIKYQQPLNIQTQCRPILYSAIGSLEHYNQFNIGSFDKKIIQAEEKSRIVTIHRTEQASSKRRYRKSTTSDGAEATGEALKLLKIKPESHTEVNRTRPIEDKNPVAKLSTDPTAPVPHVQPKVQKKDQAGKKSCIQKSNNIRKASKNKRVTIDGNARIGKRPVEMFRPSCDAYTPRMGKKSIKYKPAEERTPMQKMSGTMGSLQRPNFRDALRRVSMIIRQHIVKIEQRFTTDEAQLNKAGLFSAKMRDMFSEKNFLTPRYKCNIVKIPMAKAGLVCGMREINIDYQTPTESEIYEFAHQLFKSVQLSSECSIVCLIYIERLMEVAKVPLLPNTWKPIFMCGLLLASKVWQDLSSWNIEFASVYPQYSPDAINRLEVLFLKMVKWDLYISSSLYAKYYFALRSILEKQDFRHRYNMLVGAAGKVTASQALKIERRTTIIKEEALQQLSKSM
eukprot:CAMPEP_0197825518 /NCGR_PEP_ID=MMETSP1437-20131217/2576_1 /TAXON_ID=49252 ORGANISM="Eucampia antarctica, Strain CCMP1452" /NCGR_SAMPLE_ID=MMETSP1437 /ASSEMBLY_ACC=CAM_ASM_001096 /LENGTH=592 /DNA_ID=CAMNT_0043425535 /DNA_START=339 /DNA_END=2117 /DNA_ORIENTATION=+